MRDSNSFVRHFFPVLTAYVILLILVSFSTRADDLSPLKTWKLKTDDTSLTVGVSRNSQLCLYGLSSPGVNWNWFSSPSVFPFLGRAEINGTPRVLVWSYEDATMEKKHGDTLTIRFTCSDPPLELKSVWQARPGQGPVRHTMYIQNNATQTVTIYEQESLEVKAGGPNGTDLRYINDDGSQPDKVGVYCEPVAAELKKALTISPKQDWIPFIDLNANGKMGMYLGWEWSWGRIDLAAEASPGMIVIKAGNGDDFKTDIYPGEIFEVPPAFIGAYKGNVDDGGNSLRQYLFNYSMPALLKKDAGYPKVEFNAFAATGKVQGSWHPTEKKYNPFIDDIAPLGFEEVVIDIGWWSAHGPPGHIVTDAVDWPSGMAAAAKYAHDRGIRFGLYDNQVEDLMTVAGRQNRIDEITFLIKGFGADFYRSDATEGGVISGDFGPERRAHYPQDVGYWSTKGFYEVIDKLYTNIPTFLWENCSCGGTLKDYGAMKRASKIQAQDTYRPLSARQAFYDSSFALHPMQIAALVGSFSDWQASGSVYEFRSASMGAAYWHPDAPNGGNGGPVWSAQQRAEIKKAVTTYKERLRPLIRNGDLYHIFPRPNGVDWDGIEYYDPATHQGAVYIFKPKGQPDSKVIKLNGLEPKCKYKISFEDGSNPGETATGAALMDPGINVTLSGSLASELMFIRK